MKDFNDAAVSISPEIMERFKDALALGKWPDGRKLPPEQKEICLQAIMIYEDRNGVDQDKRIGYVDSTKKTAPCGSDKSSGNEWEAPIRIIQ